MQARTYLQQLLAKGKTAETIEGYLSLAQQHHDSEGHTSGILQSSRYHDLMTRHDEGVISQADYQLELAKINRALASLLANIPAHWEAPAKAHAPAPANTPAPAGKSFLEKWGLILGILASLAGILGITLKDILFPKKETTPVSTTAIPGQDQPASTATTAELPTGSATPNQVPSKPSSSPGTSTAPADPPTPKKTAPQPNYATPDQHFRSYAKPLISEEMELGFTNGGSRFAFRNLRTQAILCCYDDAEKFAGGKARVQQNGRYFYINKNGTEIKE